MAYPGRNIFAFSNPGILVSARYCTSSGSDVENPLTYISIVFQPSGTTNIWCLSRSANRLILSSTEGQYRGPMTLILPLNIGDLSNPFFSSWWTSSFVYVIQQLACLVNG